MGNPKQKWMAEEEEALKAGVAKHGTGKWKVILTDPEFKSKLANRSNIDLKDKWRNLNVAIGLSSRGRTAVSVPSETANEKPHESTKDPKSAPKFAESTQDPKSAPNYKTMIFEALSSIKDPRGSDFVAIMDFIEKKHVVPQNFRKYLSEKLRKLVLEGKLEKVQKNYSIKDAALDTQGPVPEDKDNSQRPLKQFQPSTSNETLENAAKTTAYMIAEAEHRAFMAAEAIIESERVSQMAEDAEAMLMLFQELFEQCSQGEVILKL